MTNEQLILNTKSIIELARKYDELNALNKQDELKHLKKQLLILLEKNKKLIKDA